MTGMSSSLIACHARCWNELRLPCAIQETLFATCSKKEEEEIDPEQLRKDMERLELIKQRRYELLLSALSIASH